MGQNALILKSYNVGGSENVVVGCNAPWKTDPTVCVSLLVSSVPVEILS